MPKIHVSAAVRCLEEALKGVPYGSEFTFEELSKMAQKDVKTDRYVISSVSRILRRHHDRVLKNVKGIGYRVCMANEVAGVSIGYQKSAKKKLVTAYEVLETVDPSQLSPEDQRKFLATQVRSGTLLAVARVIDNRKTQKFIENCRVPSETKVLKLIS